MAYHKVEQGQESTDPSASGQEAPDDNEAASDGARSLMRLVNGVMTHAEAIEKLLKQVPPTAARQIAEQKVKEVVMWAGQAFIDSEK